MSAPRVIISGGGTGGHIFPAIAIARAIQTKYPNAEVLFVGAEGKMEMEKVPAAGYKIVGLPIVGIQRRLTWKNLLVPFKIWKSMRKARALVREFKPDLAVGVGGYASGPLLRAAASMGVPSVIQEQNSYPGITNKILSKSVQLICVAYDGLEAFFPKQKIVHTGNPVRPEVLVLDGKKEKALSHFGLVSHKPVVLIVGGSLGARTINEAVQASAEAWVEKGVQVLWQTGKSYASSAKSFAEGKAHIHALEFIKEMDLAYAAADVVISRAGAMSISELCLVGKPAILVPSPNVSEDHQTKNAMALVNKGAAVLVKDVEAKADLSSALYALLDNQEQRSSLSKNIKLLGKPNASDEIAQRALALIGK
jgi:UDP-N-acetylglucosamine--N-acetylmuramyl-(pentapeptide) pyrophosphoryl-undecaprenol N-acetylglucosamine transferase